jgi:transposase-like protein
VRVTVPRDLNGSLDPKIVPNGQRRLPEVNMILSLHARG